jgi:hypothetical protein
MEDRELRRAMAKSSLRESWVHAEATGLGAMGDEEIDREIGEVREARLRGRA